jgi:hypothetical protein
LGFHTGFVSFRLPLQIRENILARGANDAGHPDVTWPGAAAKVPASNVIPFARAQPTAP